MSGGLALAYFESDVAPRWGWDYCPGLLDRVRAGVREAAAAPEGERADILYAAVNGNGTVPRPAPGQAGAIVSQCLRAISKAASRQSGTEGG
jgi:hypothetical protein